MTALAGDRAQIEAVLLERARLLARPADTAGDVATTQLVAFGIGSERYAIDVALVHRLERCTHVTPLPGAARHFAGITNLHGQLVPLIDLGLLIGAAACLHPAFVIVLGHTRAEIGILAEELLDMRTLPLSLVLRQAQDDIRQAQDDNRQTQDDIRQAQDDGARKVVRFITSDGVAVIDAAFVIATTTHEENE